MTIKHQTIKSNILKVITRLRLGELFFIYNNPVSNNTIERRSLKRSPLFLQLDLTGGLWVKITTDIYNFYLNTHSLSKIMV